MDSRGAKVLSDFVIDASAAIVLVPGDEPESGVMSIMTALGAGDAVAPSLWTFETANAVELARRRGRIDDAITARVLTSLAHLEVVIDARPADMFLLVAPAADYDLTTCDSAYLALALEHGVPLATVDHALGAAAARAGAATIA